MVKKVAKKKRAPAGHGPDLFLSAQRARMVKDAAAWKCGHDFLDQLNDVLGEVALGAEEWLEARGRPRAVSMRVCVGRRLGR